MPEPAEGERLFGALVAAAKRRHAPVATGRFGANMQVALVNDAPANGLSEGADFAVPESPIPVRLRNSISRNGKPMVRAITIPV